MALITHPACQPPIELCRRFAAGENPYFELIREEGGLQLWRTCTSSSLQFHVSDGAGMVYGEMSRFNRALEFFDALVQRERAMA